MLILTPGEVCVWLVLLNFICKVVPSIHTYTHVYLYRYTHVGLHNLHVVLFLKSDSAQFCAGEQLNYSSLQPWRMSPWIVSSSFVGDLLFICHHLFNNLFIVVWSYSIYFYFRLLPNAYYFSKSTFAYRLLTSMWFWCVSTSQPFSCDVCVCDFYFCFECITLYGIKYSPTA